MAISVDDLHDIGTGLQKLEDFIPKIVCHSVKNEFAVGKKHAVNIALYCFYSDDIFFIPLCKFLANRFTAFFSLNHIF